VLVKILSILVCSSLAIFEISFSSNIFLTKSRVILVSSCILVYRGSGGDDCLANSNDEFI